MKNSIILILFMCMTSAVAGFYADISGGALHRKLDGDLGAYGSSQSFVSELSLGHAWQNWDLAIEGNYTIGRQKEHGFSYDSTQVRDDFNWHGVFVGPTLKYHVKSKSRDWSWAPFVGVHYNVTLLDNSLKLQDSVTGKSSDSEHESWGYGGKVGVQFKSYLKDSSWLDAISYKFYGSYTKFRGTEGDYQRGTRVQEYSGDTPGNLKDYSVGFLVGISFGDKIFNKAKSALGMN